MLIKRFISDFFKENTYVLIEGDHCLIIDPGSSYGRLIKYVERNNLKPVGILVTHGHIDHVIGIPFIKEVFDVPYYISENDLYTIEHTNKYFSKYIRGRKFKPIPMPDAYLKEGMMKLGYIVVEVIETPGHTLGSSSFRAWDYLFTGDTLFKGGVGRTDFGGDLNLLVKSIHRKIFRLPGETVVCPGHGEETTVKDEILKNPYVGMKGIYPYTGVLSP